MSAVVAMIVLAATEASTASLSAFSLTPVRGATATSSASLSAFSLTPVRGATPMSSASFSAFSLTPVRGATATSSAPVEASSSTASLEARFWLPLLAATSTASLGARSGLSESTPSLGAIAPAPALSIRARREPAAGYQLDLYADATVIGMASMMVLLPYGLERGFIRPHCPCDPASVNAFDRPAIGNHNLVADRTSDAVVFFSLTAPVLATVFDAPTSEQAVTDLIIYAEVLAVTGALVTASKYLTQRPMPVIYSGHDPDLIDRPGGYRSFFSGHAALTVAALTAAAHRHHVRHGPSLLPWLAPILAGTLVSVLKVEAGRHFPTDVIAGGAVGFAMGIIIPWIHE